MLALKLYAEQADALVDTLSYYELADYGCGNMRPLDDEQADHVRHIKGVQAALDALTIRCPSP